MLENLKWRLEVLKVRRDSYFAELDKNERTLTFHDGMDCGKYMGRILELEELIEFIRERGDEG